MCREAAFDTDWLTFVISHQGSMRTPSDLLRAFFQSRAAMVFLSYERFSIRSVLTQVRNRPGSLLGKAVIIERLVEASFCLAFAA